VKKYDSSILRNLLIITTILLTCNLFAQKEINWEYDNKYDDEKLFIHAFTNYELNSRWEFEAERNLIRKNYTRASFGSITTKELLCDFQLHINKDLGQGWYFQENMNWYASHHQDKEEKSNYIGFEKIIYKNFSIYLHLAPYFDKEYIDGKIGFSWTDSSRTEYLRMAYVWKDIFYDSKIGRECRTVQQPRGVQWKIRKKIKNWWLFARGEYIQGFKRKYFSRSSPLDKKYHQQKTNNWELKLYKRFSNLIFVEFSNYYYYYYDNKKFWLDNNNYTYEDYIFRSKLKIITDLGQLLTLRTGLQYVKKNARARGYRNYEYNREGVFLPDIAFEFNLKSGFIELGYFGSHYGWNLDNYSENQRDSKKKGYIDKVKLGYTHNFTKRSKIQLSISHVLILQGFGGANAQYIIYF